MPRYADTSNCGKHRYYCSSKLALSADHPRPVRQLHSGFCMGPVGYVISARSRTFKEGANRRELRSENVVSSSAATLPDARLIGDNIHLWPDVMVGVLHIFLPYGQ